MAVRVVFVTFTASTSSTTTAHWPDDDSLNVDGSPTEPVMYQAAVARDDGDAATATEASSMRCGVRAWELIPL